MICPNCGVDKESTVKSIKALLKERDAFRDHIRQLEAENAEWKEKAKVWMASPEAAAQLDGYREFGTKVAALEAVLEKSRELKQIWQNRTYEAEKKLAAAQAKIDELMLEYCPEEMTPEQIAEWGRNQEAC